MEIFLPNILTTNEIAQILSFAEVSFHHDEDDGHHINCKPNHLPVVADIAFTRMKPHLSKFIGIDPWMKFYHLGKNAKVKGIVFPHKDQDFITPCGHKATWSMLCYLGGDYEGGETIFESTRIIAHPEPGSVLVFPHSVSHEGREITRGDKFVLKTDLF